MISSNLGVPHIVIREVAIDDPESAEVREERRSPGDKPVYEVVLRPEDGVYPLPYMAKQDSQDPSTYGRIAAGELPHVGGSCQGNHG
jgi:hypothetical protein